jgi:hypothetical protein
MRRLVPLLLAGMAILAASIPFTAGASDPIAVGNLQISQPWARASAGRGDTGAAFMVIANTGSEDDRLVSAATSVAKKTEIHQTKMEDGVMKMRAMEGGLAIPAGEEVTLKPMGLHVMMMGVTDKLVEGRTLMLKLTFEKAGSIEVAVPIAGPGAMMAPKLN